MDHPYIAFHVSNDTVIPWNGSCSGLSDKDLNALLQQSQTALNSIQQELRTRRLTTVGGHDNKGIREHYDRLQQTADSLKILERLEDQAVRHVRVARETLAKGHTNRGFKIYRQFLCDVMRHCGPGLVLLCAVGLGKQRVANMTLIQRLALLHRLRETHASLSSAILARLAQRHGISDRAGVSSDNSFSGNTPMRKVAETESHRVKPLDEDHGSLAPSRRQHPAPHCQSGQDSSPARRIEYAYSQAPVDAISILGGPLADAIRSSHQWKWERELAVGRTTDCLTVLVPDNRTLDIAINVLVGWEQGTRLVEALELTPRKI